MIKKNKAFIVAVIAKEDNTDYIHEECEELKLLATALNYDIIDFIYQNKPKKEFLKRSRSKPNSFKKELKRSILQVELDSLR